MTPYVMREAFRTNAPDKLLEFYRTVQDILHNKSMTEIEQLNRIRIMAGAAACGEDPVQGGDGADQRQHRRDGGRGQSCQCGQPQQGQHHRAGLAKNLAKTHDMQ